MSESKEGRAVAMAQVSALFAATLLLGGCGGSEPASAEADAAQEEAQLQSNGERALAASRESSAKITTTQNTIVASRLGACVEGVASSWDIRLAACNQVSAQVFQFVPVASASVSDLFLLKNQSTGLCVTARGAKRGAFVDLDECKGGAAQQFEITSVGQTQARIVGHRSKLCLTAPTRLAALEFSLAACSDGEARQVFELPAQGPAPAPAPAPTPAPAPAPTPAPAPAPSGWWKPSAGATWQWQLSGTLNTSYNVDVYDVDLVDTSAVTIAQLKSAGRRVVCYFSAGSFENWRPDAGKFTTADKGANLDGWPGERWLDIRSANVRQIMSARLDLAKAKGCDGVESDNIDGYTNATGLPLQAGDQLDYNRFLADQAHARGLAIGLKNDVDQLAQLEPYFDFAVNEQCNEYAECGGYSVFIARGKPVFNAEYKSSYVNNSNGARDALCAASKARGLRTLVLPLSLNGSFRQSCD
jgi:hypothetical protein